MVVLSTTRAVRPPIVEDNEWNQNAIDGSSTMFLPIKNWYPEQSGSGDSHSPTKPGLTDSLLPRKPRGFIAVNRECLPAASRRPVSLRCLRRALGTPLDGLYRYAESHGSEGDPSLPYASAHRIISCGPDNDVPTIS